MKAPVVLGTFTVHKYNPDFSLGECIASAERLPNGDCPPELLALLVPGQITLAWTYEAPIKRLSQASLASRRQKRLEVNLAKTAPLFADEIRERELRERPDFYSGVRHGERPCQPM